MEAIGFFAGILFGYTTVWIVIVGLWVAFWLGASYRIFIFFIMGLCWALWHQHTVEGQGIPPDALKYAVQVEGVVSTIPKMIKHKVQFQFQLSRFYDKPASGTVWMSCYKRCPAFRVGEEWQLEARIKQPVFHGLPFEMNFKNWLLSNHIQWLGTVHVNASHVIKQPSWPWALQVLRSRISEQLSSILSHDPALGIIQGLTLGLGQYIAQEQWELFRRTGSIHLVVISGEHISLIAGTCFFIVYRIWGRLGQFALRLPSQQAAAIVAWGVGCFYAVIAGLGAPVERALIGFGLVLLRYFFSHLLTIWQIWSYALLMVVFIEPHVVLTPGFYLSFVAVAMLMFNHQRFPIARKIPELMLLQLVCLIGLMPLTLFFFSYGSLNGYIANLIALPLVGWVIVPSALLGLVFMSVGLGGVWFWIARKGTQCLFAVLHWVDHASWMNVHDVHLSATALCASLLGMGLCCLLPIRRLVPVYVILMVAGWFSSS